MSDTRPARGLSRSEILDASVQAAAVDGLKGLTMRAVADRLDVTATALYRHFHNKDDLLTAVVGRLLSEVADLDDATAPWRQRARCLVIGLLDLAERHPELVPLTVAHFGASQAALLLHEASLRILLDGGFTPEAAVSVSRGVFRLVVGHLAIHGSGRLAELDPASLDPSETPLLSEHFEPFTDYDGRASLLANLDLLLGAASEVASRPEDM